MVAGRSPRSRASRSRLRTTNRDSGQSGLSPQDLRRIFREGLRRWAAYENEKPAGWLPEDCEAKIDPALLDQATEVVWDLAAETSVSDEPLATARHWLRDSHECGLAATAATVVEIGPPVAGLSVNFPAFRVVLRNPAWLNTTWWRPGGQATVGVFWVSERYLDGVVSWAGIGSVVSD
jgi:hypothetical protein